MAIVDIVYPNSFVTQISTGSAGGTLKNIVFDAPDVRVLTGSSGTTIFPIFGGNHIIQKQGN